MGICAKCVPNHLCFQYTFGNISNMAFLLVSKLNSYTLGYLTVFHPDICSVSTCVWTQTYPNISDSQRYTLNRHKCTWLIMFSLSKAIVLIFPLCVGGVFLIFRAGRASVNCQRPRNELRKIFRTLDFRGRTFINGKNQRIQVCRVGLSPKRRVICVGQKQREQQIVEEKWKRQWVKWTFKPKKLPHGVFGAYVCHLPCLPESININDGWKYFSLSAFHFTNWWTNSLPTGFRSMCFSHPSMSAV